MDHCMLKTGACSVVLGRGHYRHAFPDKKGKLMKITKTTKGHNEFNIIHLVRRIDNYSKYYSIPDELSFILKPTDKFYSYLKKITTDANFFYGPLKCCYMEYAGDKDLLDTLKDMLNNYNVYWTSYSKILKFTKHIMMGLGYLHDNRICHLDIKPENIIVNTRTGKYKIIDFGFSSLEPFDDFVYNIRGTPSYFPRYYPTEPITLWLPKVEANDMEGNPPMRMNRYLVYKIDSYCFGRVLYFLKYLYEDQKIYACYNNERKQNKKLNEIIDSLLHKDVYSRLTILQCIEKYFNTKNGSICKTICI